MKRTNFFQKRKPIYLDKNNKVCFSKSFLCTSILEIMIYESKRGFNPSLNPKNTDMSLKDPSYFKPAELYTKISDIFIAFYNQKIDRNTFYYCISLLEKDKKLKRIKIKRQIYYRLIEA